MTQSVGAKCAPLDLYAVGNGKRLGGAMHLLRQYQR